MQKKDKNITRGRRRGRYGEKTHRDQSSVNPQESFLRGHNNYQIGKRDRRTKSKRPTYIERKGKGVKFLELRTKFFEMRA